MTQKHQNTKHCRGLGNGLMLIREEEEEEKVRKRRR
jgi:hypothetical protein